MKKLQACFLKVNKCKKSQMSQGFCWYFWNEVIQKMGLPPKSPKSHLYKDNMESENQSAVCVVILRTPSLWKAFMCDQSQCAHLLNRQWQHPYKDFTIHWQHTQQSHIWCPLKWPNEPQENRKTHLKMPLHLSALWTHHTPRTMALTASVSALLTEIHT